MYYILNKNIALRSFWLVPYAFYVKYRENAIGLSKDQFEFLLKCDGNTEIDENEPLVKLMLDEMMIHPCKKGTKLDERQKYLDCNNRYMPKMNWMITGKCNYNCLHCFNALDNAPLQSEWSYEDSIKLLDEAKICGINAITLTGGEPMVHKHFLDIVKAIYERGMYIFDLNTNGFFITQEILDEFKKINCNPLMKISFDGLGFHDWMRNHKGAEEETLKAIKLCIKNKFCVMVQMQFNKKNKDSIFETLKYLDSIGVNKTRIIWTSPAPRWEQNAYGKTFLTSEYYDECLTLLENYTKEKHNMSLIFWQFAEAVVTKNGYNIKLSSNEGYRENLPLCKGNRGMIAISSSGDVFPCLQMSGYFEAKGKNWGNVKKDGLTSLLQSSNYMCEVCATVKDLTIVNEKCRSCKRLKECLGGCRALAVLYSNGDLRGSDITKCLFYNGGYYTKLIELSQKVSNVFDSSDN